MRRTTKIIIGLIAFFLLMSVVLIIRLSAVDQSELGFKIANPNQLTTLPIIEKYQVVKIINVTELDANPIANGITRILPLSQSKGEGGFSFPKELAPYIRKYMRNDTLMIEFNYNKLSANKRNSYNNMIEDKIYFNLYVDPSTPINVECQVDMMHLYFEKFAARDVILSSKAELLIDSCQTESLTINNSQNSVIISNSKVHQLNASLDYSSGLETPNSVIGEFNVSGSSTNTISLSKMNCKKINWKGKGKKASLTIQMDSTVSTVSFD